MNNLAIDRALDTEMQVNGFEKSEIASNGRTRVFFNNLSPLRYTMIVDDVEIPCEAPRSIVVEASASRDHYNVYTFSPTLMLDRQPLSPDLRPTSKHFELHEFAEWLPNLNMLFIIEAIRRGYGIEFDSRSDREREAEGESVSGFTGYGGFA